MAYWQLFSNEPLARLGGRRAIPRGRGKPVWAVALSFNGRTRQFKGGTALPVK